MNPAVVVLFALLTKSRNVWSSPDTESHRIVDLTHVFDNTTLNFPGTRGFESNPFLVEISKVRVQLEEYSSGTHVGTHLDAPCHIVAGRNTVNEIPLDRLIGPAAVVDICDKVAHNPDYELQIKDLVDWEHRTGILLNDVILLVRSGWSKYWSCNTTAYFGTTNNDMNNLHFPGVGPSASKWLVENRNIYGVGVETLSIDYGQSQRFLSHVILYEKNIYGLENLGDMSKLPLFGSTLHVLPMKIGGACGAPVRVVAISPEKNLYSR